MIWAPKYLFSLAALLFCLFHTLPAHAVNGDAEHCGSRLSKFLAADLISNLPEVDRNCVCHFYASNNPKTCYNLADKYKIKSPADKFQKKSQAYASQQKPPGYEQSSSIPDRPDNQQQQYSDAADTASWGKETAQMESEISKEVSNYSRDTKGKILEYTAQELDRAAQDNSIPEKNLQNDYRVFQAASRSYRENKENGGFSEKIAASAKDENVKELMLMYSSMDTVEKKAEEAYAVAQQKILNFGGMAAQNIASGRKLAQAGSEMPGFSSSPGSRETSAGKISSTLESSSKSGKENLLSAEKSTSGNEAGAKDSGSNLGGSSQDSIRDRLRNQLRAKLAKSNKAGGPASAREEEMLGDFGGELNGGLASPRESIEAEQALDQLIGAKGRSFSLLHSETDAFVKSAINELDSADSGILEAESRSIFVRVKEYYNRCLKAECVGL